MTITQIAEEVTERILEHEAEARAYEAEMERGRDLFESSCAARFHEGCCEALRELLDVLEDLVEVPGEPESSADSVPGNLWTTDG